MRRSRRSRPAGPAVRVSPWALRLRFRRGPLRSVSPVGPALRFCLAGPVGRPAPAARRGPCPFRVTVRSAPARQASRLVFTSSPSSSVHAGRGTVSAGARYRPEGGTLLEAMTSAAIATPAAGSLPVSSAQPDKLSRYPIPPSLCWRGTLNRPPWRAGTLHSGGPVRRRPSAGGGVRLCLLVDLRRARCTLPREPRCQLVFGQPVDCHSLLLHRVAVAQVTVPSSSDW